MFSKAVLLISVSGTYVCNFHPVVLVNSSHPCKPLVHTFVTVLLLLFSLVISWFAILKVHIHNVLSALYKVFLLASCIQHAADQKCTGLECLQYRRVRFVSFSQFCFVNYMYEAVSVVHKFGSLLR